MGFQIRMSLCKSFGGCGSIFKSQDNDDLATKITNILSDKNLLSEMALKAKNQLILFLGINLQMISFIYVRMPQNSVITNLYTHLNYNWSQYELYPGY